MFDTNKLVSGVAVKIIDELKANKVKSQIRKDLKYPYFVMSWMDMNKNLFSALMLEKIVMFVILILIVIVACFNIGSSMVQFFSQIQEPNFQTVQIQKKEDIWASFKTFLRAILVSSLAHP